MKSADSSRATDWSRAIDVADVARIGGDVRGEARRHLHDVRRETIEECALTAEGTPAALYSSRAVREEIATRIRAMLFTSDHQEKP